MMAQFPSRFALTTKKIREFYSPCPASFFKESDITLTERQEGTLVLLTPSFPS